MLNAKSTTKHIKESAVVNADAGIGMAANTSANAYAYEGAIANIVAITDASMGAARVNKVLISESAAPSIAKSANKGQPAEDTGRFQPSFGAIPERRQTHAGAILAAALAILLAVLLALQPYHLVFPGNFAFADDDQTLTSLELQEQVEATQANYADARMQADAAAVKVEGQEQRITQIEAEIPIQQERSGHATRELYKIQQQSVGIITILVGAQSLGDFIAQLEYISRITSANMAEIQRLADLREELQATREELIASKAEADARVEDAQASMEAAQWAQAEEERRVQEAARIAAEAEANAKALEETPRANDSTKDGAAAEPAPMPSADEAGESEAAEGDGIGSGPSAVDSPSSTDEASFVAQWAPRIDAYLAGSPLAGTGKAFASAAYANNVDPRWSPAIACTESGKGAYCFLPHNAWGWGSCEWDSWEEAINDHVRGLANGYGFTISVDAAKKYCPPNWKFWFNTTSSQMELI